MCEAFAPTIPSLKTCVSLSAPVVICASTQPTTSLSKQRLTSGAIQLAQPPTDIRTHTYTHSLTSDEVQYLCLIVSLESLTMLSQPGTVFIC